MQDLPQNLISISFTVCDKHCAVADAAAARVSSAGHQVVGQAVAGDIQHTSSQVIHKGKGGSETESDGEQLRVKPMPKGLHYRKLQSNPQHEAHQRQQPMVKLNTHEAVTVDLPTDQPSSSAVVQTATQDSGASPQSTPKPLEAPSSLRRSARHQQSAHPAAQGVILEAVNNAGAQAAIAQADVAVAKAATTATATAQLQGQDQPRKTKENKEKATAGKQDHLNKQLKADFRHERAKRASHTLMQSRQVSCVVGFWYRPLFL